MGFKPKLAPIKLALIKRFSYQLWDLNV